MLQMMMNLPDILEEPALVEVWLSHPPLEENRVSFHNLGEHTIDSLLSKLLSPLPLERNDPLLYLSELKYNPQAQDLTFGVKVGPYALHYFFNRDPIQPDHIKFFNRYSTFDRRLLAITRGFLPLTTTAVTITIDGYMVLGKRPNNYIEQGKFQPIPSGYTTIHELDTRGTASTFGNVYHEFFEEILLTPAPQGGFSSEKVCSDIGKIKLHGMTYRDFKGTGFVHHFSIETPHTRKEIQNKFKKSRKQKANTITEIEGIDFIPFDEHHITDFLSENFGKLNYHSLAGIPLVAKNYFSNGTSWYESMIRHILPSRVGRILELPEGYFEKPRKVSQVIYSTRSYWDHKEL